MSNTFPTLSKDPSQVVPTPIDNALKSAIENGQTLSRRRFTRDLWQFEVTYDYLANADVALLKHPTTGFWKTVGTYDSFAWTYDGSTFNVKFAGAPKFTHNQPDWFQVSFTLETA